jgi:hypothetical protein
VFPFPVTVADSERPCSLSSAVAGYDLGSDVCPLSTLSSSSIIEPKLLLFLWFLLRGGDVAGVIPMARQPSAVYAPLCAASCPVLARAAIPADSAASFDLGRESRVLSSAI